MGNKNPWVDGLGKGKLGVELKTQPMGFGWVEFKFDYSIHIQWMGLKNLPKFMAMDLN